MVHDSSLTRRTLLGGIIAQQGAFQLKIFGVTLFVTFQAPTKPLTVSTAISPRPIAAPVVEPAAG